ncbi:MAG: YdgA family protein, partial [Gammaproteobacteria bacterium]|nr:YdgA family protein [Gammaproteobacteria bacterium]
MKKGIVAILILLALVVVISPALVGRLAEKSVDEQLKWAADENNELKITSTKFDRGWFSSEGTHRIELGDSTAGDNLKQQLGFGPGDPTPAIIIDTRLDHGLIPVTSVSRPEGSLLPGLGRAASTISIESPNGEVTQLPGVIYSDVGLNGDLTSQYFLDAGSMNDMSWGAGNLKVTSDAYAKQIGVHGGFDSISMTSPDQNLYSVGNIEIASDMTVTEYGYAIGDIAFSIASVNIGSENSAITMGPITLDAATTINDGRISGTSKIDFAMAGVP